MLKLITALLTQNIVPLKSQETYIYNVFDVKETGESSYPSNLP